MTTELEELREETESVQKKLKDAEFELEEANASKTAEIEAELERISGEKEELEEQLD